jgi:PAS domain S-box-containing protein
MPAEEYASVRALQENRLIKDVEMGIVKPDEAVTWINVTATPLMDDRVVITYNDITERKRAEEALRESKALLAKAEQLAHLGSWEWDIEPDQFTLSEGWQRVHGCHIGQLSSETLLPIAHPDDRARIEQAFDQALKGQQPYDIEHRIIRQDDGEVRIIQAYGEVIRDAHGNPIKMYGATQDITERKRAEHALQQRNRRLAELNAIVSSLTSTLSLEEVLQRILEATPQFFSQKHSATIQLLEEDGNLHQRAASNNIPAEKRQNIFRPGEGIAGRVVEEQRPINVADVTAEPDYLPGPIPPYYRSLLVVPLVAHNQLLGTLSLSSKRVGAFDIRDMEMLQGLAGYAAIAVYNAQLYEQTQQDAETKALLLREVNHRVKNNLDAIIGLLYVERRYAPPEALSAYRPIMDDLTQRITGLSEVHQMLSGGEWAPLNLSELAERIIQVMVRGARDDVNITLDVLPASVYVQPAQAQHLALILSELTTNTLKYGVNGRDAVHIAVRITQEDDIITLIYRNDGPGYPDDVLRLERHSAGLDIVKRSVRKNLRGELTLRNEDGAVTEIRFRAEDRK